MDQTWKLSVISQSRSRFWDLSACAAASADWNVPVATSADVYRFNLQVAVQLSPLSVLAVSPISYGWSHLQKSRSVSKTCHTTCVFINSLIVRPLIDGCTHWLILQALKKRKRFWERIPSTTPTHLWGRRWWQNMILRVSDCVFSTERVLHWFHQKCPHSMKIHARVPSVLTFCLFRTFFEIHVEFLSSDLLWLAEVRFRARKSSCCWCLLARKVFQSLTGLSGLLWVFLGRTAVTQSQPPPMTWSTRCGPVTAV